MTGFRVVTAESPATFTRTRYCVPQLSPPMVTSVCVVEMLIGAAPATPTPSATTTATTPKLSGVDLRNAGGVPLHGEVAAVTDCRRCCSRSRPTPRVKPPRRSSRHRNGISTSSSDIYCQWGLPICQTPPTCCGNTGKHARLARPLRPLSAASSRIGALRSWSLLGRLAPRAVVRLGVTRILCAPLSRSGDATWLAPRMRAALSFGLRRNIPAGSHSPQRAGRSFRVIDTRLRKDSDGDPVMVAGSRANLTERPLTPIVQRF